MAKRGRKAFKDLYPGLPKFIAVYVFDANNLGQQFYKKHPNYTGDSATLLTYRYFDTVEQAKRRVLQPRWFLLRIFKPRYSLEA